MSFTEAYKQDSVTIGSTEYSLTNNSTTLQAVTTDGAYELWMDVGNMAAGDILEIRVYEKFTSTAGSQKLAMPVITLADAQPSGFRMYLGILTNGWEVSAKQTAGGSNKAFSWSIKQVA